MNSVHRHRPSHTRALLAVAAFGAAAWVGSGCVEEVGQSSEFATDSFASPTDHGELVFGVPNPASFTDTQRFHGWHFALGDRASLELRTELETQNLDTVMYLYRRSPGSATWGTYVAQNDDSAGSVAARIAGEFQAGEYFVKVKAAKIALRGDFALVGGCDGPGCPAGAGDGCDPDSPVGAHQGSGFSNRCGAELLGVAAAPVTAAWSKSVAYEGRCELGGVAARSVQYYRAYWDELVGWNDFVGEPDETAIHVAVTEHGAAGTVVDVDIGGDEDGVAFVYDASDRLVMYFHSEQSSTSHWTCGVAGEASDLEPQDEECAGHGLGSLPHRAAEATRSEGTTSAAAGAADLGSALLGKVVAKFAAEQGLGTTAPIGYELAQWADAAELTLAAADRTTTFYAGGWNEELIARTDEGVTAFVCEPLE